MDIRSYFQTKKTTKPKPRIEDDDDDVIPESPDVQIRHKTKKEESKSTKNKSKPALKEVKATALFGDAPIKRTEPVVKKEKKKTETGIHSDDDFEKSLLEIDAEVLDGKNTSSGSEVKAPSKHIEKKSSKSHKSTKQDKTEYEEHSSKLIKDKTPAKEDSNKTQEKNGEPCKSNKIQSPSKRESMSKYFESKTSTSKDQVDEAHKKRKFSEFLENEHKDDVGTKSKKKKHEPNKDSSISESKIKKRQHNDTAIEDSMTEETHEPKTKKYHNNSLNESVLTDEERHERKRQSAALYQSYLNRSGPKHLGSKIMPEGAPNCLKDCSFLLTGVLDSFEKEEIAAAVIKYGGCIKSGISKKVTHVLAGEDAGPAKMAKAQELGIKIIGEDDFLKMIEDTNKSKNVKVEKSKTKKENDESNKSNKKLNDKKKVNGHSDHRKPKDKEVNVKQERKEKKEGSPSNKLSTHSKSEKSKSPCNVKKVVEIKEEKTEIIKDETQSIEVKADSNANSIIWVEKYKPKTVKNIIGQTGENSNVNKLTSWLTKWYANRKAKLPKPSPWAKNDDGGYYKAALLSGPPGVGKTTTVALVCASLGFDAVEFNASDTRNKTLIREQIGELLTTNSLAGYAKGDTGKQAVSKKHVLVMDEVDGMAGNEDRGGLQELIALIKAAAVPIVCMCNDRASPKMRSLLNYCYDLRFSRPRVDQIKSAMMSICFKENIKIPPDVLGQLIVSANQDVRQTLNLLSMWAANPDPASLRRDASSAKKDVRLGPWEAVRKVFSAEDHKAMSINDRSDLFFYDYSLAPLFVQENYLQVAPHCPKHEVLQRISSAADNIAMGDVVEARIRSKQAWSLLPVQAMYSSVLPGHSMSGHVAGQINFPGWLGKHSRATKMRRLCQEIHAHTRLSTSGSKSSIFLDYATHLRDAVLSPLIKDRGDGVSRSLEVLASYHLLREDLESLSELALWPGQRNPAIMVDSKVKAAMTRTYNKSATALPYAPGNIKKGRARDGEELDGEDEEVEDEPDSDPENDALIKKKKSTTEKPSSSKEKASTSKAKASTSKDKKKKK